MTAVLVVGPHRSGTSAVAGVLHHLGLFMGDKLLGPARGNTKGHYEDLEFLALHDQIIGRWDRPHPHFPPHRAAYIALITKREASHQLWGLKDPRLCFMLRFFVNILPDTKIIFVYRDSESAICSLMARNDFAYEKAENIIVSHSYAAHVGATFHAFHDGPQMHIWYEQLIENTAFEVARLNHFIGDLSSDITAAVEFIDPTLQHHKPK